MSRRISLTATTPQGTAGQLDKFGFYAFTYGEDTTSSAGVSLRMPVRLDPYTVDVLPPFFQMNLPEGYILEQIGNRLTKATTLDPMVLLAMTGGNASIGRVVLSRGEFGACSEVGVELARLLADQGADDLFQTLAENYLLRSGVSGVQPKLLVPEWVRPASDEALLAPRELIVKTESVGYPGLAINEFVCMSIAKEAGIPVPDFYLSDDGKRFVVRRFDRMPDGRPFGFEDIGVLAGLGAERKYSLSYEAIAQVLSTHCSPAYRQAALDQLFDQLALSCMVGNGDAHLKNFGVIYTHPVAGDVRMCPAYDIVCTTCYIPEDTLALTLNGQKGFMAARADLEAFGRSVCKIADPLGRMARLVEAAQIVMYTQRHLIEQVQGLGRCLEPTLERFEQLVVRRAQSPPR